MSTETLRVCSYILYLHPVNNIDKFYLELQNIRQV